MNLLIIRMKVFSEKRKELSQTIASLIRSIRTEKGCKRCNFCQDIEDENALYLLEEWDTQENLKSYLKSEGFKVLRGAMNLLKEPCETEIPAALRTPCLIIIGTEAREMMFHTAFHPAGMEEI